MKSTNSNLSSSLQSALAWRDAQEAARPVRAFAIAGKFNYHRAFEPERRMAELKSIFEQIDPDEEAAAIAEAEAELDAGKGVPHEKVREWLLKLARGEITPPPCE
jgi:predicted transcriptional regulator